MLRTQEPNVKEYSSSVSHMNETVHSEVKELSKIKELLNAAHALTLQESSLRAQDMSQ